MYARRKIPAPFNGKPCQKAVPLPEKTEETSIPVNTEKETGKPTKKTTDSTSPLLALLFLDLFSTQKKGDE